MGCAETHEGRTTDRSSTSRGVLRGRSTQWKNRLGRSTSMRSRGPAAIPIRPEGGHNFALVVVAELGGVKPQEHSVDPKCEARLVHDLSPFWKQTSRAGIPQQAFQAARF